MISMLTSVIGQRGVDAMAFLLAFALTALTDSIFRDKLPHDHGRAFAVNGELSKGKARGSGLIFVLCIALVSLAFLPFNTEYVVYNVLLIASMLSGYLDDAAETAWNEYKKGIIDFVIAVLAGVTYLNFNGCGVHFLQWSFTLLPDAKRVVLLGGGIGNPPMLPLAQYYQERATVISGFRSAEFVILQEAFQAAGAETILCTDNGTVGRHGLVTEPLQELLQTQQIDAVYACGPKPMLRAIANLANNADVFCEVSLEERMGCGIGACLVCACKLEREGKPVSAHVCKDGPVFSAKEVVWE